MENQNKRKKILLTGDRPTGKLHLGHYVGSLRNRVAMQNSGKYIPYIFISDLQALTDNARDPEKIRREQEALIRILANNLVHDPGTIASKQDLYSLPKKIVAEAKTVCLQLNAKHFAPELHSSNKLYIEGECSKLEKLILKELRGYSAEVVQVVHQSAEINVQQINDLNAFVEGLAKFTVEREQKLEQVIYDINEEIRRMSDDTGIIIAEDKKSIENIRSQMAELRQRAKERS